MLFYVCAIDNGSLPSLYAYYFACIHVLSTKHVLSANIINNYRNKCLYLWWRLYTLPLNESQKVHPLHLKGQFTQTWKFSHHLLTLMSFHDCMIIFRLSKEEFSWICELLLLHTMKLERDQVLFMSGKNKDKHFTSETKSIQLLLYWTLLKIKVLKEYFVRKRIFHWK